jgi:primosomal replication protein N
MFVAVCILQATGCTQELQTSTLLLEVAVRSYTASGLALCQVVHSHASLKSCLNMRLFGAAQAYQIDSISNG